MPLLRLRLRSIEAFVGNVLKAFIGIELFGKAREEDGTADVKLFPVLLWYELFVKCTCEEGGVVVIVDTSEKYFTAATAALVAVNLGDLLSL